ncbi:hypothetical protein [Lewinella sp. IMCC34183]|uniref:hypothetical protein n=1 Tax=Lewinella sp. IMCC34183 TaxID=2248762 RepID=UPI000E284C49|nr:hypothetical protein [Lewinella sp. IMCC34183]
MHSFTSVTRTSLLVLILSALLGTSQRALAQQLVYGQTYKLENTWMNRGAYLEVAGQGCQDNYLCVSTTTAGDRKSGNTSDWIILSATGKQAGQPVESGDMILLKNPWMRGSYLGTRGYGKDFGCPGYLCVSAWQNVDGVKNTTWQVKGDVKTGGIVQFIGQWNNASAGYLDMAGHRPGGNGYNAVTTTEQARIKGGSTMWTFRPSPNAAPAAAATKNILNAGESLAAGEKLVSANGKFMLIMQPNDGNLVVYRYDNGKQGGFVWGSMQYGFQNARLEMQSDGNLVVYAGNDAKWSSKTHPYYDAKFRDAGNKPVKLVLQDNGKLNLITASGTSVWSS